MGAALVTSLYTATISTVVIGVLGVPLAYVLAVGPRAPMRALSALVALPLALPPLMSGLLLLYVVGPYTSIGRLFDGRLTDTVAGIVLAQTFVAAPFLVIAARAAFAGVDPALLEVAASLGHGRLSRFRRFAVPAALPGIAAGLLLAWLRAFGEFGATVILAYHPYSLPVFTFVQFDGTGLPGTKLPIVLALGAALVVLGLVQLRLPRLLRRLRRRRRPGRLPAAAPAREQRQPSATLEFDVRARAGSFSLAVAHRAAAPRLALLGASGAGKTLTLRALLGTHPTEGGTIRLEGSELAGTRAERRGIGYVAQQPALLARRRVREQVMQGRSATHSAARHWIEAVGLAGLEDRYPDELSGGQQRRVAIARALADRPRVLLLDEPFTGLDTSTRQELIEELRALQEREGLATVLVTHDPREAVVLADEIVIVEKGRVLQSGPKQELFDAPAGGRAAAMLGFRNVVRGKVAAPGVVRSGGWELSADTGSLAPGASVAWTVAPERVQLREEGRLEARVLRVDDLALEREVVLGVGEGVRIVARCPRGGPVPGDEGSGRVRVLLEPGDVRVLEEGTGSW